MTFLKVVRFVIKLDGLKDMYVHISVPIQDSSNDLQLYRVHNLPLKVCSTGM